MVINKPVGLVSAQPEHGGDLAVSEILTTDTVYIPPEKRHPKLKILSVAPIFADAIRHNIQHQSLNDLYVYGE